MKTLNASKGGYARANILTADERKRIAKSAANARWGKAPKSPWKDGDLKAEPEMPYSMFRGNLKFGPIEMECHVLNDGRRVFTQREMVKAISGGREAGDLGTYISNLPCEIDSLSMDAAITFKIPGVPSPAIGREATILVEICDAYLEAKDLLKANQKKLAIQAEIIMRACAKVGIIALIDEATGYQKIRAKNALQLKLQAFIADEMQEWAKAFPTEFWVELARLEGVHYSPRSRPLRWGKYVMAFVYDAIDPDVGRKLREKNPKPRHGQNHHQWLKDFGKEKLNNQLQKVITIMQLCEDMDEFRKKFGKVFKKTPIQLEFADILD